MSLLREGWQTPQVLPQHPKGHSWCFLNMNIRTPHFRLKTPNSLCNAQLCTGNVAAATPQFSRQKFLPGPHKKAFLKHPAVHKGWKRCQHLVGVNKAAPSQPRAGSCCTDLHRPASVRGRAAWNTNPTDFIAHDLFRSGLSVPRALSAAQGSVTAPPEWKDFYYEHNYSVSHQSWGTNPGIKGCCMKSLTFIINVLFHFI